jgi:hypothetical protein
MGDYLNIAIKALLAPLALTGTYILAAVIVAQVL